MNIYLYIIFFSVCFQTHICSSNFLVISNSDTNVIGTFRYALNHALSGDIIQFQEGIGTIVLTSNLPVITQNNLEIIASEIQVIDGVNNYRVFAIGNNNESPAVSIRNISVINGCAQGGSGGYTYYGGGGGGGLGAGGGVFIKGNVTLDSVAISDCQAIGGRGGDSGDVASTQNSGGGGGGAIFSAASVNGQNAFPISQGGAGGGSGGGSGATTLNQSGGNATEISGGGGGAAPGSASPGAVGGNGGGGLYGGGGGGAGSGATTGYAGGNGGNGGFGAGGGGAGKGSIFPLPVGGSGGVLGGDGGDTDTSTTPYFVGAGGGGGAGVGGAIFVYQGSSLTLSGSSSISDGTVTGGNAGTTPSSSQNGSPGSSFANGIFLDEDAILTLDGSFDAGCTIDSYPSRVDGGVTLASGVVTLSRVNTYSGGTTLLGGTLSIASASNIGGSSAGCTLSGGVLHTTGATTTSGSISITDNSTLHTDVSTIFSGTLTGSNNTTLTLSGSGTNSLAAIAVNGSDSFTISGVVGGSQTLTKLGTGTLILRGANHYSGGTALNAGGILLAASQATLGTSTVSMVGDVALECEVDGIHLSNPFSLSAANDFVISTGTTTLSGPIGGSGTLNKKGVGSLLLTDSNPYTGSINVLDGRLIVNGSIAHSTINLNSGSILKGTGTLGSVVVNNGGTVVPGNSIGTMNASSITFDSGAIFQVEISPTASSLLDVIGTASIAGHVQVIQDAGFYAAQGQYLILNASSISGAFNPIVLGGSNGFTFSLSQLGNSIYLLYMYDVIPVPNIATFGLSGNARKIALYLNQNASGEGLSLLDSLTGDTLKSALNSVSPSRNAFGTYITKQVGFSLSNLLTMHIDKETVTREESAKHSFVASLLADASDKINTNKESNSKFTAWISGFGEFAHQKAHSQNPSFNFISEAVVTGVDYHAGKRGLAGCALGYAHTHFYDEANAGYGNINYYFASAYGNVAIDHFYISPAMWGVFNQNSNTRKIAFPGYYETAKADIFAWQMIPHLEAGYEFKYSWGGVCPFTAVDLAISWQRTYTEQGAVPFNAVQKANNSSMVRSEIGVKFCEKWSRKWGIFFLKEKIAYVFEKPFGVGVVNASFSGMPGAFTVNAVNQTLNLAAIGLDFLAALGKNQSWLVDFSYNGEIGVSYWSNDLTLSLTKHF